MDCLNLKLTQAIHDKHGRRTVADTQLALAPMQLKFEYNVDGDSTVRSDQLILVKDAEEAVVTATPFVGVLGELSLFRKESVVQKITGTTTLYHNKVIIGVHDVTAKAITDIDDERGWVWSMSGPIRGRGQMVLLKKEKYLCGLQVKPCEGKCEKTTEEETRD